MKKKKKLKKILKIKKKIFENFWNFFFFQNFHYLVKKPLTWGCLYNLWEVPIARIWKNICGNVIFGVPEIPLLLGVLGAWMTFKKAEMAKTLKNGLSMNETNPLNHNWSHFMILSGLTLHQFQKKLLLSQLKIDHRLNNQKKLVKGHEEDQRLTWAKFFKTGQNAFWTSRWIRHEYA